MDNIRGFQPNSNYFDRLYNQRYDRPVEPGHDENPPEVANQIIHFNPEETYYNEKMLVLVRQIVAFIPGNNFDLDVSNLRPEELVTKLKERLEIFFSPRKDFRNLMEFLPLWEGFLSALRALDACSALIQIGNGLKDMNHFADLQDTLFVIISTIPPTNFIAAYYKVKGMNANNPKFILDDLTFLQKATDFNRAFGLSRISWVKGVSRLEISVKLTKFQYRILNVIHDETPLESVLKKNGRWTAQDYEVMCDFFEVIKRCHYDHKEKVPLYEKLRSLILSKLLYSNSTEVTDPSKEFAEREFSLDPMAFTATTRSSLVTVLEELFTINPPKEYRTKSLYFYDYELLPLLEHFNKIMDASPVEVRKIYHQVKVNILKKFCEFYNNKEFQQSDSSYLVSPKNIPKICWICIREMAEIGDTRRQKDIDPLLSRILCKTIHVLWCLKDHKMICDTEEKCLLVAELEPLLGICNRLLDTHSVLLANISTQSINLEEGRQFNNLAANSICSRESVWSDKGTALIEYINHPDIQRLVKEYRNYRQAFDTLGLPDRSIEIQRQTINFHSTIVPEYVINEIQKDGSISTKDFKAILYGFYCGYDEDSALLKHWEKGWAYAVTRLHPEVAEEPAAFFKRFFSEEFDEQCIVFFQTIEKDFGPADMSLAVDGKSIPVHQEVLKCCASLLGPNYFSGLFSGRFEGQAIIDLDHPGSQLMDGNIRVLNDKSASIPFTYRGACLQLMDIYLEETDFPHCGTFRGEQKHVRDLFFPVSDPLILSQKFNDKPYTYQLLELRYQYFLQTKLTNNISVLAEAIADFYVKNSGCDLVHMCEEAFKVANEKRIRILGNVENLMDLIQQKAYARSDFRIDLWTYSDEEKILYFRYMAEHIEEGQFFRYFYGSMPREVFSLGEKGRAIFRKKAFNFMKTNLTSINEMSYFEFNNSLTGLIRLLSFAEIIKLTTEEVSIVTEMVNALPGKLPLILLDSDYNINLKNQVVKQWGELNQKLGTQIPFVIDFGLEALE